MFSSEHAIWNFANAGDELDDWLGHAEWLVSEWAKQTVEEVRFKNTFDIILAALLLEDGLLPNSATAAFAKLMLETINEAIESKARIKCLHIHPPKPGRKEDRAKIFIRFHEVSSLIQEGNSTTDSYKIVAEKHCKSIDTIRRDYERMVKKHRERKEAGKIDK